MILCRDIRLLLVILYRDSNLSPSELHLVRVLLLLLFLLLRLLVLWSWFLICLGFVWVSRLRLFVECWHLLVLWGFFKGFCCPPVFCGLGVSCWGRVKDFGMSTLVVRGFLSVVIV